MAGRGWWRWVLVAWVLWVGYVVGQDDDDVGGWKSSERVVQELGKFGIKFGPGAFVYQDPYWSRIVMYNRAREVDKYDWLVQKLYLWQGYQWEVRALVYRVTPETAERFGLKPGTAAGEAWVRELLDRGESAALVAAQPDDRASSPHLRAVLWAGEADRVMRAVREAAGTQLEESMDVTSIAGVTAVDSMCVTTPKWPTADEDEYGLSLDSMLRTTVTGMEGNHLAALELELAWYRYADAERDPRVEFVELKENMLMSSGSTLLLYWDRPESMRASSQEKVETPESSLPVVVVVSLHVVSMNTGSKVTRIEGRTE